MQQFVKALIAALFIGISLSPQAQQTSEPQQQPSVHVVSMTIAANLPNAQAIARQILSPDQVKNLQQAGMALALNIWRSKENADCFASVGPTSAPAKGYGPRNPTSLSWAMSEFIKGDEGMATCDRAFQAAVQGIAQTEALSLKQLQLATSTTRDPANPKFPATKRLPKRVSHVTGGNLNDNGKKFIADELGPRWYEVLDHRKFAAHVFLMEGKTLEGKQYCLAEYGIVAKPPEGVSAKYPAIVGARWKVMQDNTSGETCTRLVLESALERLRNEYPEMLEGFQAEAGMTYPSITDIKKQAVQFDANQDKPRPTPVASLTQTNNVMRCTNQCQNGSCIRSFADGRKERWQAPRVYDAFTQNWEWDTTTNACGG